MVRAFFKLLKDLHTYQKDRGSIYKHKFSPGKEGGEKDLFTFYNKENSVLFLFTITIFHFCHSLIVTL